jgi:hypothetical protein
VSKTAFRLMPDLWLSNPALRSCSAPARALWIDILALCHGGRGYLLLAGKPVSDDQLARIVGASVDEVFALLAELGEAGIYSVDDDGRLYSSRMVKEFSDTGRRTASTMAARNRKTPRGAVMMDPSKVARPSDISPGFTAAYNASLDADLDAARPHPPHIPSFDRSPNNLPTGFKIDPVEYIPPAAEPAKPPVIAAEKRPLPWWATPAGWIRQGGREALSMQPGEDLDQFKVRLSARMPPGPHLDALTPAQRMQVEAVRPKESA